MISALKQALSEGSLIITATRRLAKQWQPLLASQRVGPSPKILSQKDWLNGLWMHLEACGATRSRYCLSDVQAVILWKKIIESSEQGERLLRIQATAKSVASAWGLLKQWNIGLADLNEAGNEETQLFLKWAHEFNQVLGSQNLITTACLPEYIIEAGLDSILDSYSSVKKIKLLGFEDIPPQLQSFYTDLRLKGWDVSEMSFEKISKTQHYKYAFYDQAAELRSAALWAKSLKSQANYPGSIGIVVPDLADCRSMVEQIFTEVLEPLSELKGEQVISTNFNISVAPSLAEYPIVFAALQSLMLLELGNIERDLFLFLIKTPFIDFFGSDLLSRACYMEEIKKSGKPNFNLAEFISLVQFKGQLPTKATVIYWSKIFQDFFLILGWPGKRVLNSIEHQAMARFQSLLEEFSALDQVLGEQDLGSAIRLLVGLAHEIPFQGQSKPAPIHIMGILEASSQPFEYCWVTGLHNEAWPPIPKANPFLPMVLQRKHKMPHASSEREYYFAQKLTDNLKNACDTVIFSYFKNDTVKAYYPSDLIGEIVEQAFELKPQEKSCSVVEFLANKTTELDNVIDNQGPVVSQSEEIRGGTGLIQAQAACPFKAFVQYRLHAQSNQLPTLGLSALERGILVHKILEQVWFELKTHKNLCWHSQEALDNCLLKIIHHEIQCLRYLHTDLTEAFWEVEQWRLTLILQAWLKLEKERNPFTVIEQEHKATVTLAGLTLNMRFDRVDYTDNHEMIIVDYKTSEQALSDCFGERPQSPQLPLYCLSSGMGSIKGAVFAQLQAQGCQFVGITEQEDRIPGVKTLETLNIINKEDIPKDWQQLLLNWRENLEMIAREFQNGEARVDPYKGVKTCRTCHLLQVCRRQALEN